MHYDVIIIGSGAAGLSAAVYTGRYNLKTLVIGKEFGGETARAGTVENYPGFTEIDGYDLMANMKKHAEYFGAKITEDEVSTVERKDQCLVVNTKSGAYHATAVILAMGSERRRLGLPNEKELTGNGVHYCVTCDGPLYSGGTVAVVGGGDAAAKGVSLLAEYAKKVYLLVRGKEMRAEPVNQERIKKLGDKLTILYETEVKAIERPDKFEKIVLSKEHNGSTELPLDALFIEIGAQPNTALAEPLGLEHDKAGYIIVDEMMKTNVPGLYAAGDLTNHFGHFKQDITAAAMGAVAATSAYGYYKDGEGKNQCMHE